MKYSRIMGIDYGTVRVGIALTDPMQIIARPYTVLKNNKAIFENIEEIINEKQVSKIIVGLPINLAGTDSKKTIEVRNFARELANRLDIPLEFSDERFTSKEANQLLKEMGYSIQESRKVIDKIAAALILKNYLDSLK